MDDYGAIAKLVIMFGIMGFGLIIIASGEFFLAIREMTLNTRPPLNAGEIRNDYKILETMSTLNNIVGYVIIVIAGLFYFVG